MNSNNEHEVQLGHTHRQEDDVRLDWDMQEGRFDGALEIEATRTEKQVGCKARTLCSSRAEGQEGVQAVH